MTSVAWVIRGLRDALRVAVTAEYTGETRQPIVEVGLPLGFAPALITFGGQDEPMVEDGSQTPGPGMGPQATTEDYSIRAYCTAVYGDTGQLEALDEAVRLHEVLRAVVRDNPTLSGFVTPQQEVALVGSGGITVGTSFSIDITADTEEDRRIGGRYAQITSEINVKAKIY